MIGMRALARQTVIAHLKRIELRRRFGLVLRRRIRLAMQLAIDVDMRLQCIRSIGQCR